MCIGLCAYSAIEFDERRKVSVINEAMCKGCGSCAGHCPSGAAQVRHFNEKQIFAEMEGLLGPAPPAPLPVPPPAAATATGATRAV